MGKGSRNRQLHLQDKMEHPEKYKQKKQMPKWLTPVIGLVLVAAILVGVVTSAITNSGIIKRSRIILESQTGKFDVNQQMATFLVWQEIYYSAYTQYLYYQYGIYKDEDGVTKTFKSADQYALTLAQLNIEQALRDCVDDIMEMLKMYVAVCDEAYRNDVTLDSSDKETLNETITQLKSIQTNYGYVSFSAFLKDAMGSGMKESDIEDALELVGLYNKYSTQMQDTYEKAVTIGDLDTYLAAHPEDFYLIDYLTFAADNEELAQKLKDCETPEEFKALVLENHLEENYKSIYNKYTTTVTAKEEMNSLGDKTGDALNTALDGLEVDAVKTFNKDDDYTGKEELKTWLFKTSRKQYETDVVTTENGIYLVAFFTEEVKSDTTSVSARVKFYKFVEGDETFRSNIFEYIKQSKAETPSYPTVDYKEASTKANDFKTLLKTDGADIAALLEEYNAVEKTDVTSSTSSTSTLPKKVIDAATASTVKAGDVLITNDGSTYYVIYVSAVDSDEYDISFVTFEDDIYYRIIDDLTTSLDKVYPTDKVANYDPEADEDTFEAWISELSNKDTLTSARAEGDTAYFEEIDEGDKDDDDDDVTTYDVYMVINTPMYIETEEVVKGGYLKFDKKTFAQDAKDALETLKGKTNLDLLNALAALGDATTKTALHDHDVESTDEALSDWLFSEDREANDIAVVTAKDGKSAYVAVYVEKLQQWQSDAKTAYVTEQLKEWINGLTAAYTPNEKVLDKLGEPTTTEESTSEEESSSTEDNADLNG